MAEEGSLGSSTPTGEGLSFFSDVDNTPVASPVTVIDGKATPRASVDCEMPMNEHNRDEHLPAAAGPLTSDDEPFKLRCMICIEKTANPVMFPCLDIFCLPCLEKQFVQQQQHRISLTTPRQYRPELNVNNDPQRVDDSLRHVPESPPIGRLLDSFGSGNDDDSQCGPPRCYDPEQHPPTSSVSGSEVDDQLLPASPPNDMSQSQAALEDSNETSNASSSLHTLDEPSITLTSTTAPPSVPAYDTLSIDSSRPQPSSSSPTNPANHDEINPDHDPTGDGQLVLSMDLSAALISASPRVNPYNVGGTRNDENSNQFNPFVARMQPQSPPLSSADHQRVSPGSIHSSTESSAVANYSQPLVVPPSQQSNLASSGVSDYSDPINEDVDEDLPNCANDQERQQLLEQDERDPPAACGPVQIVLGPWYDVSEVVVCDQFCCPLCQYQTGIPLNETKEKVANKLRADFVNIPLQNIEHFKTLQHDLPRGKIRCAICSNIATSVCCSDNACNYRPLCVGCQHLHLQEAKARGETKHTITDVDSWEWQFDLKRRNEICKVKGGSRVFDQQHNSPKILYCADHDEVICAFCTVHGAVHNMSNCKVSECEGQVHEDAKRITERNLRDVELLNDQVKEALERTRELKENLQNKCAEKRNLINERYDELIQKLKDQRDTLLENCDRLCKFKSDELQKHHFKLNKIHEPLNRCIEFVSWFKNEALPSEFMMLKTQINRRLKELKNTYRDYQYEPHEDDRIYFDQSEFDVPNEAIGRIYSTPSVKNFSLVIEGRRKLSVHNPVIITVIPRDAIDNDVPELLDLHERDLLVSLKHIDSDQSTQGCGIIQDAKTGKFFVTVYPSQTGKHQLRIYERLKPPYNDRYIERKGQFDVNDLDFTVAQQMLLVIERIGKAIIDPVP